MRMVIETITPVKAAQILELSERNRPLQSNWVRRLSASMKSGEWALNGESIKFSTEKKLIDGQHRLAAIVASGVTISIVVLYDVAPEAFDTLDQIKRRSASDVFAMTGEKNVNALAAVLRTILSIERIMRGGAYNEFYSTPQIEKALDVHPLARDIVNFSARHSYGKVFTSPLLGVLTLAAEKHGEEMAQTFLLKLIKGDSLAIGSPILALRERLQEMNRPGTRLTAMVVAVLATKAWNAYITKREMKLVRYSRDEAYPGVQ
jgi:hypothetical protein